jgi:hypothetical protein
VQRYDVPAVRLGSTPELQEDSAVAASSPGPLPADAGRRRLDTVREVLVASPLAADRRLRLATAVSGLAAFAVAVLLAK